jgi:uncharacterized membrane protein
MDDRRLAIGAAAGFTAVALAQMADLVTFLQMVAVHGLEAELNPLVVLGAESLGLEALVLAKVVLVVFVVATFVFVAQVHRRMAASVLTLGTVAGLVGAFSNVLTIL